MVDIIGGNRPALPSGDGGCLSASVVEVSPRLYLLCLNVLERFAGIELIVHNRRFRKAMYETRLTAISKNADGVLAALVGRAAANRGENLPACLQQLPEGETHDGATTIGRSRYLLMFPTIRLTVGLDFKITATQTRPTEYLLRATTPSNNPEQIMGELYRLE